MKHLSTLLVILLVGSNLFFLPTSDSKPFNTSEISLDTHDTLIEKEPANTESEKMDWWNNWFRDTNNNRIDDLIDQSAGTGVDEFPVFIDFNRRPTSADLEILEGIGAVPTYTAKYIDTICAENVPFGSIEKIALLPDIVMVELQPEIQSLLDVSSPSIRSGSSVIYSPYSVSNLGYSGNHVVIAIVDTGVDDNLHRALRGSYVGGADLSGVLDLNNTNPNDEFGHGTHTAGTALGNGGRDGQYVGIAPNASLVDVKISLGLGGDILEGIEWTIDNKESKNISVISLSAGSSSGSDGTDAMSRAANRAVDSGMVFMASAGNDGRNFMISPAAADKVIAVGATSDKSTIDRSDDTIAGFSNYGPRRSDNDEDNMDELKPELVAPGVNIMAPQFDTRDSYISLSGTSMSCPQVAGTAALMLEANPHLTPLEIRELLIETAESRGSLTKPELSDKYNGKYGFGILDAYGAVKRAENLRSGTLEGPSLVKAGLISDFSYEVELTRTEFMKSRDVLDLQLKVPGEWSEPEQVEITNDLFDSGISSSILVQTTTSANNEWLIKASIEYSGEVSSPYNFFPKITFKSKAPVNVQNDDRFRFTGSIIINDLTGEAVDLDLFVEPQQESIDLYVNSNDITFSNENPVFNENVVIKAMINNSGTSDARNVMVNFTDGPPRTGRVIGTDYVNKIPAGGANIASVTWTATPGVHTIYVVVDPLNTIPETDENNNVAPSTPIVVQGGINNPPSAELDVIPPRPSAGQPVTFDGSDSRDSDGEVVKYLFDFGDGLNSSWIDFETTQHVYEAAGTYVATLVVEDNGGQQSLPVTQVVNVTGPGGGGDAQYYFYMNSKLLDIKPVSNSDDFVKVPNSFSGGRLPSWKYAGNWSTGTDESLPSMNLQGQTRFFAWVQNKGSTPVNLMQLEFTLKVNNANVSESAVGRTANLTPGGDPELISAEASITQDYRIKHSDRITVSVRSLVNSNDAAIVFASMAHDTRVEFHYEVPELFPPEAQAGPDSTAYVNEDVAFNGNGIDDGEITLYQWDFDGDLIYDWESTTNGITTHSYDQPGIYFARLQVTDDDGLTAYDERKITINSGSPNQEPTVDIHTPEANEEVEGTVMITGRAQDELEVKEVQVSFNGGNWNKAQIKAVGSGVYTWAYEWDTTIFENGPNSISARSYDGSLYSTVETISVEVNNIDMPPEILSAKVKPVSVEADGETVVVFTVEVFDDGPPEEIDVTIDLRPIGGRNAQQMYDDQTHGDKKEDDQEYTYRTTVPGDIEPGEKELEITVTDGIGQEATAKIELEVLEDTTPDENSPPELLTPIAEPTIIPNDGETSVTFTVLVQDEDGLDDIELVVIDLSPIGGSASTIMSDDGISNGDSVGGDGIYTFTTVVPTTIEPGEKQLTVFVTDKSSVSAFDTITLVVKKSEPVSKSSMVEQIFDFLTQPTILFIIGLIIILAVVVILLRISQKGKKRGTTGTPMSGLEERPVDEQQFDN